MPDRGADTVAEALEKLARLKMLDPHRYAAVLLWVDEYLSEVEALPESMRASKIPS